MFITNKKRFTTKNNVHTTKCLPLFKKHSHVLFYKCSWHIWKIFNICFKKVHYVFKRILMCIWQSSTCVQMKCSICISIMLNVYLENVQFVYEIKFINEKLTYILKIGKGKGKKKNKKNINENKKTINEQ